MILQDFLKILIVLNQFWFQVTDFQKERHWEEGTTGSLTHPHLFKGKYVVMF